MKKAFLLNLFLLFCFLIVNVKAQIEEIRLEIIKSSPATKSESGFDNLGRHQKIIFRVSNDSQNPIILFGEREDGFEPENDILTFYPDKGKWLYLSGKNVSGELEALASAETETYLLKPGKSIKFERLLQYSCLGNKYKMVVFFKTKNEEPFRELLSPEISLQGGKDYCR